MQQVIDFSGIPTPVCPMCGCKWLKVPMMFDDQTYDVAMWGTKGECYECGTILTVCSPPDKDGTSSDPNGDPTPV